MSESVFASIIEEYASREWEKYSDTPEHKFSLKHRLAMRKIFRRYERNTAPLRSERPQNTAPYSGGFFRPRRLLLIMIIIMLGLIAGCSIVYFSVQNIRAELHNNGMTEFSLINVQYSPEVIEDKYYLSAVPGRFVQEYTKGSRSSDPQSKNKYIRIIDRYVDPQTYQAISFRQTAKPEFEPRFLDLQNSEIEEVDINGHKGFMFDYIGKTSVIWDNGEYVFELSGNLSKNEILNLAKSAKIRGKEIVLWENYSHYMS